MTTAEIGIGTPIQAAGRTPRFHISSIALAIDVAVVTTALIVAYLGRNDTGIFDTLRQQNIPLIAPMIGIAWLTLLWGYDVYDPDVFEPGSDEIRRVIEASLVSGGLVCVTNYLAHHQLSRGFFTIAYGLGLIGLVLGRLTLRAVLRSARRRGLIQQRVALVGGSAQVDEVAAVFAREPSLGYRIVGALTSQGNGETPRGIRIVGTTDQLVPRLVGIGAETVVVTGGTDFSAEDIRSLMWDLEPYGIRLVVAPTMTDISAERVKVRPVGGLPLVHLEAPTWRESSSAAKRTFDVTIAALTLAAAAPVLIWAAISIKLADGGPVLYRQARIGRDGVPFDCLKFRTMVVGAAALQAALQAAHDSDGMLFKLKEDPRITRPGRWLRRYSVDELPQLFNVLRGDMSLVGPRPQVQAEVEQYDDGMRRRLHVRPGMTGLWQVSGRSDLSYEDARRLDVYYVDNWSLDQDISILRRTFRAVLAGRGAY